MDMSFFAHSCCGTDPIAKPLFLYPNVCTNVVKFVLFKFKIKVIYCYFVGKIQLIGMFSGPVSCIPSLTYPLKIKNNYFYKTIHIF